MIIQGPVRGDPRHVEFVDGRVRLALRSAAFARWAQAAGQPPSKVRPPYSSAEDAAIVRFHPVASATRPSPIVAETELRVAQWVDERTYSHRPADQPQWTDGSNFLLDWLEAKSLDYLASIPDSAPQEIREARDAVWSVDQDWSSPSGWAGKVIPDAPCPAPCSGGSQSHHTIILNATTESLRRPGTAPTAPGNYVGLRYTYLSADQLPSLMLHEARHCWQLTYSKDVCADRDGDLLVDVGGCVPLSATEQIDSANWTAGGQNPEGAFLGPSVRDEGSRSKTVAGFERNAVRFEVATGGLGSLQCGYHSLVSISGNNQAGAAGTEAAQRLVAEAKWNTSAGGTAELALLEGVAVLVEVVDSASNGALVADSRVTPPSWSPSFVGLVGDDGRLDARLKFGTKATQVRMSIVPSALPPCDQIAIAPVTFSATTQ